MFCYALQSSLSLSLFDYYLIQFDFFLRQSSALIGIGGFSFFFTPGIQTMRPLGSSPGENGCERGSAIVVLNQSSFFFYIINLTIEARRKRGRDAYKQKRLWVIDVQVTRCLTAADPRQPFSPQLKHKHLNFRLSNMNINRGSFYRDARNGIF